MIGGRPAVFISCSERFRAKVADSLKAALSELGLHVVIVTEEPRLAGRLWEPEEKVESYLRSCEAFVALVTPDEQLADGRYQCRLNIPDEVGRARNDPRLQNFMIIVKSLEVDLWSNVNPTYDRLDVDDPGAAVQAVITQLRAWGIVPLQAEPGPRPPRRSQTEAPAQPATALAEEIVYGLGLGDHDRRRDTTSRLLCP